MLPWKVQFFRPGLKGRLRLSRFDYIERGAVNKDNIFNFSGSAKKADRIVICLSLIGLIVASLFLFNEDLYNRFIGGSTEENTSRTLMGVVTEKINDTRFKSSFKIEWVNAKKKQNVRAGDSLFTGNNSRSQVSLTDGNAMTLDQNTLVVFNETKLMDLNMGNFRLKVEGKMTLAVQGQTTVIEGNGSDIQIIVPKEKGSKPQVRLLRGRASVQVRGKPRQELSLQKVETLPIVITEEAIRKTASVIRNEPAIETIQPTQQPEQVNAPAPVPVQRRLQIYDVFELNAEKALTRRAAILEAARESLPLGETVSLSSSHPEPVTLNDSGAQLALSASGSSDVNGYIYEVSTDRDFPHERTRTKWNRDGNLALHFKSPGTFYYRVRGANQKTELTAVSEPVQVVILPQEKVIAPVAEVKEPRKVLGPLIVRKPTGSASRKPRPTKIEKSQPEKTQKRIVQENDSIPESIRKPTAVASTSAKMEPEERTNETYGSSRVDFETGTFTVFSPDEKSLGRANPYAYMVGIRSKHWFNDISGFEGIARVKAAGMNETANGINPLDLEARYHYRLRSSWVGRTNLSLLAGAEVYRNIGRGYFAQKYNLGKLGFALDFPIGNRWDAGGDVVFGMGADQTKKYEAVGRLNYYFRKRYSFGLGYRLYLLEAGSEKTAPLDYPYKETWGEGFLLFRWHY